MKEEKKDKGNNLFEISATELQNGPVSLKRPIPIEILEARLSFCEYDVSVNSADVDVELELCSGGVLVRGQIDAKIKTQCGTCLADTVIRVTPEVSTFMSPKLEEAGDKENKELTPEDLEREWFDGHTIVLDELLLDTLMLEVPMNPKCGTSCPGLASVSVTNESNNSIDPRLAPLAGFKLEKES